MGTSHNIPNLIEQHGKAFTERFPLYSDAEDTTLIVGAIEIGIAIGIELTWHWDTKDWMSTASRSVPWPGFTKRPAN